MKGGSKNCTKVFTQIENAKISRLYRFCRQILKIAIFGPAVGKVNRSKQFSIAVVRGPRYVCVPNFSIISQKLRPAASTQNLRRHASGGQTGLDRFKK